MKTNEIIVEYVRNIIEEIDAAVVACEGVGVDHFLRRGYRKEKIEKLKTFLEENS